MRIDLHCEHAENVSALRDYVTRRMSAAIARFQHHIQWARVKLADVDGEGGGVDKRCVVQLRLRNLPDIMFAITRIDALAAVDLAAERLSRVLGQRLQRQRHALPSPV